MIILDPLFIALGVLHDSIKLVSVGSLSDFTMMSAYSNPISRSHETIHEIRLRHIHSPVDFVGITVRSTALVALSGHQTLQTFVLLVRRP